MQGLILVIEDEVDLATTLEYAMGREGFDVRLAHTGADGLACAGKDPLPDAIVLDLMLPDLSGTEVFRRLREIERTRGIPVLICTAKGSETDRVVGLELGADDYIVKPFSVRELILRVRAVLRRGKPSSGGDTDTVSFGVLKIDREAHRTWIEGKEVVLTALEFRLLSTFVARKGRVQTRDSLLSEVWGISSEVTTRTVDTHVKRLREKLGAAGEYIETLRGVGYRFRDQPEEE